MAAKQASSEDVADSLNDDTFGRLASCIPRFFPTSNAPLLTRFSSSSGAADWDESSAMQQMQQVAASHFLATLSMTAITMPAFFFDGFSHTSMPQVQQQHQPTNAWSKPLHGQAQQQQQQHQQPQKPQSHSRQQQQHPASPRSQQQQPPPPRKQAVTKPAARSSTLHTLHHHHEACFLYSRFFVQLMMFICIRQCRRRRSRAAVAAASRG
jgi:hypothetical protein